MDDVTSTKGEIAYLSNLGSLAAAFVVTANTLSILGAKKICNQNCNANNKTIWRYLFLEINIGLVIALYYSTFLYIIILHLNLLLR